MSRRRRVRRRSPPGEFSLVEEPMPRSTAAVLGLLAVLAAAPARADDFADCAKATLGAEAAIASCTRAIATGKFSGRNLAILHINRGVAHGANDDLDQAIADYETASRA